MSSLLLNENTFNWSDHYLDRKRYVYDFVEAVNCARNRGDKLCINESFYTANSFFAKLLMDFFWCQDFENCRALLPWIDIDTFLLIGQIFNYFTIHLPDCTLQEAKIHINEEHVSWTGPYIEMHDLVYDKATWLRFHHDYVKSFTLKNRQENTKYFNEFYQPELLVSPQSIRDRISSGQAHDLIDRIDVPKLSPEGIAEHKQQTHIHLKAKKVCALNIDGSWKHKVDSFKISVSLAEELVTYGFVLPDDWHD